MRRLFLMSVLLLLPALLCAGQKSKTKKADRETVQWRYEIQNEAVGADKTVLVCVWSYSKDVNVARRQALKNAVHGLVFKGAAANNDRTKRARALRPLVSDPAVEQQRADFFDAFFADGGDYARYVSVASSSGAGNVVKMGKEYKVAVFVSVQYDELRRRLQSEGIVGGLGSVF